MARLWRNRLVSSVLALILACGSLAGLIIASARAQAVPGGITPDTSQTSLEWRDCATAFFVVQECYGALGDSACGVLTVPEN